MVSVAATQMSCTWDIDNNIQKAEAMVRNEDHQAQWQKVMQGHAVANIIPICASNRCGSEKGSQTEITFYGTSFIADTKGVKVAEANREEETVLTASFDFDEIRKERDLWTFFRDRRPAMYDVLYTKDGRTS